MEKKFSTIYNISMIYIIKGEEKHLIKDNSLYLPEDYIREVDYRMKYKKWK